MVNVRSCRWAGKQADRQAPGQAGGWAGGRAGRQVGGKSGRLAVGQGAVCKQKGQTAL